MLLTIQIVNYNSRDNLVACLRSIRENISERENLQIVVVNNDQERLGGHLSDFGVDLIEKNENVGFGRAHNLGLQKAEGEYILLLNPDTKLFPETVAKMASAFLTDEKVGIAGPLHIGEKGVSEEEHFGFRKTPLSLVREKISRGRKQLGEGNIFETDWVSGAAMMIKKDLLREMGGFDENYFMYFEDVDLCFRAKKKGWKVIVHPEAKVFHKSGQSFLGNREKKKCYYQSQDYYIKKNFGLAWTWIVRILRFPFYVRKVYLSR